MRHAVSAVRTTKMQQNGKTTSTKALREKLEEEECDEQLQVELTNAIEYTESLLRDLNLLPDTPPDTISTNSMATGDEICVAIQGLLAEKRMDHH